MFGKGRHGKGAVPVPGKKKRNLIPVIIIAALVIIGVIAAIVFRTGKKNDGTQEQATSLVTRGEVELTISGSGTVEPYERYEVIPLVNGEIVSAPYDVGDYVEEGEILYQFDTTDMDITLKKQENSMRQSTITYNESLEVKDDLEPKASCSGVIQKVNVKAGDDVTSGQELASIINTQTLLIDLPFNESQVLSVHEGSSAELVSSENMSRIYGTVTNVSSIPTAQSDGSSFYYATVEFENPGAVVEGAAFGGSVNGVTSPGYGNVRYSESGSVMAKVSGKIYDIYYKEGDFINQNDVLLSISSSDVENSLEKSRITYNDAQLSLQNTRNSLDDYKVTSPISGTVLTKNSKVGDTIDRTNSSVTMMVIGDVSKLKFTLSIDELDVAKVNIGQKVKVTADAIADKEFEGEITEIAMEGTASNGVTVYEAIVTINDPQELKPSMNVDAVVVVDYVEDAVRVPSSDVTTAMGKSFVFVKDDNTKKGKNDKKNENMPENMPEMKDGERPQGMPEMRDADMPEREEGMMQQRGGDMPEDMPEMKDGEMPEGMPEMKEGDMPEGMPSGGKTPAAPDGFRAVEVEIGVQGDEYTEILSGLTVGQEIYQQQVSSSGESMMFGMGGGMPGGGMGGGMAGGGMGGGMPGGGGGGMGPR